MSCVDDESGSPAEELRADLPIAAGAIAVDRIGNMPISRRFT
jgi:hypothetical protein